MLAVVYLLRVSFEIPLAGSQHPFGRQEMLTSLGDPMQEHEAVENPS